MKNYQACKELSHYLYVQSHGIWFVASCGHLPMTLTQKASIDYVLDSSDILTNLEVVILRSNTGPQIRVPN